MSHSELEIQHSPHSGHYFFDLNQKANMHLYYAVKNRFEHRISEEKKGLLVTDLANAILKFCTDNEYDNIIIPESSQTFIEDIVNKTGITYLVLKKNTKEYILNQIDTLSLQKKEKENHILRINGMGSSFKINHLKANQRRKYFELIFQKPDILSVSKKSLIIDDSYFSGITVAAIKNTLPVKNHLSIFAK